MTEDEKLNVYIDQTLQIDRNDPTSAARVHDITGAWKMRASEPQPLPSGWRETVVQIMGKLQMPMVDSPTVATGQIIAAMDTLRAAIDQANLAMQSLATRDEVIRNQSNILDAFATLLQLENGKYYMDMVPMIQALVEAKQAPAQ